MFDNRKNVAGPKLRLPFPARRHEQKRVFDAALGEGESPDVAATAKMVQRYFEGPTEEERQPVRYSLLGSLVVIFLSLYIVWPTIMEHLEIQKEPVEIHAIAAGASPPPAPRNERRRVVREEMRPMLYPDLREVQIISDEELRLDVDSNWNSLDVDGRIAGIDTGYGSGLGPVFGAGDGDVTDPVLIHEVKPDYPERARAARLDGLVVMEAIVNTRGEVVNIRVLQESPPNYGFGDSAEEALAQCRFRPGIRRGRPVNVRLIYTSEFNLFY